MCRRHGGATPQVRAAAERRQAEERHRAARADALALIGRHRREWAALDELARVR